MSILALEFQFRFKKNRKRMKIACAFFVSCVAVMAQTNESSVLVTNWVTAPSYFRVVDGQVYNPKMSKLWGEVVKLADPEPWNTMYHYADLRVENLGKILVMCSVLENQKGSDFPEDKRNGEYVKSIVIYNCPNHDKLVTGQFIDSCIGMRVKNWLAPDGQSFEAYDCGMPCTTNKIPIIKWVKIGLTNQPPISKKTD